MEMYAYKCTNCGELHHPKHQVCKKCNGRDFDEIVLKGKGTVVTWTKAYNLPEGYMKPFMCFAIVKFDDTGLVVSGQLDCDEPKVGMRVESTVDIIKEGIGFDYYGFIYKPIEE